MGDVDLFPQSIKDRIDVPDTRFAGHGIGIFGVDEDKIGLEPVRITLVVTDGRCLETVGREDRSDIAEPIRSDKSDISLRGIGSQSYVDTATVKAGNRGQATVDGGDVIHS